MSAFKGLYRGHGIYWHGRHGYGDETKAICRTMAEYKAKIDTYVAAELAKQQAEDDKPENRHWRTLSDAEKRHWRHKCFETDMTASQLAYAARPVESVLRPDYFAGVKDAHEMTLAEFMQEREERRGYAGEQTAKQHRRLVEAAIKDGEHVPEHVLADYPDLIAQACKGDAHA